MYPHGPFSYPHPNITPIFTPFPLWPHSPPTRHRHEEHGETIESMCIECDKYFEDPRSLKRHMKVVHDRHTEFRCTTCEVSKRPIRTGYLGHVTGYQPIRDQYFLVRSVLLTPPPPSRKYSSPDQNMIVISTTCMTKKSLQCVWSVISSLRMRDIWGTIFELYTIVSIRVS